MQKLPVEIFEKIMNFSPQSIVKKLIINGVINKRDMDFVSTDKYFISNLLEYSVDKKPSIAEKLILSGIDPNIKLETYGSPLLSIAAYKGRDNLVNLLIRKKVCVNAFDNEAIKFAALKNHRHIVNSLISAGSSCDYFSLLSKDDYLCALGVYSQDDFVASISTSEFIFDKLLIKGCFNC
jgi:hypothetical protein